ncbi:F-box protein At4g35733-like [Carex rostrata]
MDEKMYQGKIIKAILSDDPSVKSDFTVVFLYSRPMQAVFWCPGDIAWTYIGCIQGTIKDAVFFQGRLYVIYAMGFIYTIEVGPNPTATIVGPMDSPLTGVHYLVDFMDELLLVQRNLKQIGDMHFVAKNFDVHKVDLESKKLSPCTDLGDYAFFLGANSPVVVDSRQFQGCKRSSIYFTDMMIKISSHKYGRDDLGVYDMKEDTTEPYYPPKIFQPFNQPPIWLTPNCRKLLVFW